MNNEKKTKVNIGEMTFDEMIQFYYDNPNETIKTGVLLESLRKLEYRMIHKYGLKDVQDNKDTK